MSNTSDSASPIATSAENLVAENASLRDRLLRALAESENTRLRADRATEDARKYAIAEFARELLTVVDNLERAVDAAKADTAKGPDLPLNEGVQATLRAMMHTFNRFGIRRMEVLGRRFDPHQHEAIMSVDDSSQPAGTIVRVVDQGYTIHGRLLRPALVVITKLPAQAEPASSEIGFK